MSQSLPPPVKALPIHREPGKISAVRSGTLQRKAQESAPTANHDLSITPAVENVLRSPGQPLDPGTRAYMEPRFGHDFGGVRVHTDERAAESARAVNALAYTVGRNIVFGAGYYSPGMTEGRRLLAHELTHVVQQSAGPSQSAGQILQREENKSYAIPEYEFAEGRQKKTEAVTKGRTRLAYDGTTFKCTFYLDWRWHASADKSVEPGARDIGDPAEQEKYKADFVKAIKESWEAKAPLFAEFNGRRPTGRSAKLQLEFVDMKGGASRQGGPAQASDVTTINVMKTPRPYVQGGDISLDPSSLSTTTRTMKDYRAKVEGFNDYKNLGVPIHDDTKSKTVTQTTVVHEFGHILGFADEYVMLPEDIAEFRANSHGQETEDKLKSRSHITRRLMNIGSEIPNEYFSVFASWLTDLTGNEWRISGEAPKPKPKGK